MIEKLREKIFDCYLKRQATRQVVAYPWKEIRSIVILHEGHAVGPLIQQLQREGKQVYEFILPDKQDICWLTAMPKKNIRQKIQARHYDLLIDLTQQSTVTMQYMALLIQAGFKTGRNIGKALYDLSIDTPAHDTPNYLYQQIVKYIQMFTQG